MDEYCKIRDLERMNASIQLASLSTRLPGSSPLIRKRILAIHAVGKNESAWSNATRAAHSLRETDWRAISLILGHGGIL